MAWITDAGVLQWSQISRLIALVRADERERLLQGVGEPVAYMGAGGTIWKTAAKALSHDKGAKHLYTADAIASARLQGREEMRVAAVKVCEDYDEKHYLLQNTFQVHQIASAIKEVRL